MRNNYFPFTFLAVVFLAFLQKISIAQRSHNVTVVKNKNTINISNGLLGVVIPSETAFSPGKDCPAPVQSFIYSDGTLSDNTVNYLTAPTAPVSMKIKWLEQSKSVVRVAIEYRFQKKEFQYWKQKYKGGEAGPGYYHFELSIKRGEKTIVIEEDSNYDIAYSVKISDGLSPDKARYRGWSAASVQYGYELSGKPYRSELERGYPMDATVDLDYSKPFSYPRLVLWEPAGGEQNSGRYWQVYNSKAPDNANLFGFFQGKPERLIGATSVGVQLQILPGDKVKKETGAAALAMNINRRGPDNSWHSRKRFQWVAFISTKTYLLSPEKQQPIGTELNRISGLGSIIATYATKPVKLIPAFYTGAIYMPSYSIEALCKKIKTDGKLYQKMVAMDGGYKGIWDAWVYPDSATALKKSLIRLLDELKEQYINGEGTYLQKYRYWKGSNQFKYYALAASALFADPAIKISATERKSLEQLIGLMARVLWDDNNVPLFDSSGINLGPNNMTYMYKNSGRIFFALLLANDPEFAGRAKQAAKMINNEIEGAIYANGSSFGTPHYTQPTIEPVLFSMLQLKQAGVTDLFKTNPKIVAFARFYSMLLTPPSVRLMNNRKLISFGDGSEESAFTFALLATGLKNIDPSLSRELLSSFYYGPERGTIFGSVGLTVDLSEMPARKFTATTANYTGYASHFRSALNTNNETALWVLNGDKLYDHRNDDAGEVAIYALQAPLSLSRSSFYYPSATDARIRSVVVPESMFPEWNKAEQPISGRSLTNRTWPASDNTEFANLGKSSSTTVKMEMDGRQWFRKINRINLHEEAPIIVFYDSLTGKGANIWSMMMMSEGAVNTPAGPVTPEKKMHNDGSLKQLPKATAEKQLVAGLNRFLFTGQNWPMHFSNGINWELYSLSPTAINFTLADWGTTWQNTIEKSEFQTTNKRPYSEEQQIIRLHSNNPFFNVLLPYAKDQDSYQNKVKSPAPHTISVKQKGDDIIIHPAYYAVKTKDGFFGALLSPSAPFAYAGVSILGGYTELEYNANTVKVRVHGNTGKREITLPFLLKPSTKLTGIKMEQVSGTTLLTVGYTSDGLDLPNGEQGYKEFIFSRK